MSTKHEVARFVKISTAQWKEDTQHIIDGDKVRYDAYCNTPLPRRATNGSAGYDFIAPINFTVLPGEVVKIPTCVCCEILDGWYLQIVPRSSVGIKRHCMLANSVAVVDADYYHADNEGHIWLAFHNYGDEPWVVSAGERIAQGVFTVYGVTTDDNPVSGNRTGGIGSTGK